MILRIIYLRFSRHYCFFMVLHYIFCTSRCYGFAFLIYQFQILLCDSQCITPSFPCQIPSHLVKNSQILFTEWIRKSFTRWTKLSKKFGPIHAWIFHCMANSSYFTNINHSSLRSHLLRLHHGVILLLVSLGRISHNKKRLPRLSCLWMEAWISFTVCLVHRQASVTASKAAVAASSAKDSCILRDTCFLKKVQRKRAVEFHQGSYIVLPTSK